jgi:hypothetical protein
MANEVIRPLDEVLHVWCVRVAAIMLAPGAQGLDAQLVHHVLVILIGGEGDGRR